MERCQNNRLLFQNTHTGKENDFTMKKILVTGGKGFIGSKIVEMLSNDYKVTVVDNNDTYGIMTKTELEKLYKW